MPTVATPDPSPPLADGSHVRERWSPDGRSIVFVSDRDGDDEVYLLDTQTGRQTRLTYSAGTDGGVIWDATGTLIFFMSQRNGDFELYSMNVDGSNQRSLTDAEDAPSLIYFAGITVGR